MATGGRRVNGGEGAHTVREMGYSLSEFAQVLPAAMRDWTVSGGPDVWQVSDRAGLPVASIATQAQSVRLSAAQMAPGRPDLEAPSATRQSVHGLAVVWILTLWKSG